jgi:hypothetical protein
MADTISFTIVGELLPSNAKIILIEVLDTTRNLSYAWRESGGWINGETPKVQNQKNVTITVRARNDGYANGIWVSIQDTATGYIYGTNTQLVANGATIDASCSITMPVNGDLQISAVASP